MAGSPPSSRPGVLLAVLCPLGIAVLASVALSLYRDAYDPSVAEHGFLGGLTAGCLIAAEVALAGALLVARDLPHTRPPRHRRSPRRHRPGRVAVALAAVTAQHTSTAPEHR